MYASLSGGMNRSLRGHRPILIVLTAWLGIVMATRGGMERPRRAMLEGLIILAGILVLAASPAFRKVLAAAPRPTLVLCGLVVGFWFSAQLRVEMRDTFPFVSWHMYGESRNDAPLIQYLLTVEECGGGDRATGPRELLGTGGGVRTRLGQVQQRLEGASSPEDSAAAGAVLDDMLAGLLRGGNARAGTMRFCGIELGRMTVPAGMVGRAPLPAPERLRHVTLD